MRRGQNQGFSRGEVMVHPVSGIHYYVDASELVGSSDVAYRLVPVYVRVPPIELYETELRRSWKPL